jgi:hypothetical protein
MLKQLLLSAMLTFSSSANAQTATPGPLWDAEGTPPDPKWSETYYPVAQGAVMPRTPLADERPSQTAELDRAWEAGIRTYLRRVSHMVAGMNLPDQDERMRECGKMAALVHDNFDHTEGRRRGHAFRSKSQLVRACHARAFLLSGFYALSIRAVAVSDRLVQVRTCYYHDQYNDPLVTGGGHVLPNGRQAIPRVSVETVQRQPNGEWQIILHVALDSDEEMIRRGCRGG